MVWGCGIVSSMYPLTWVDTVTILNKLDGKDSMTRLDTWKKTVVHGCFFKAQNMRTINGTSASVAQSTICRIPKSENYHPYSVWKNDISDGWTLSPGDYIILGEVAEDVTADNVAAIVSSHKPDAMLVRAVSVNTKLHGMAEHYRAEGV